MDDSASETDSDENMRQINDGKGKIDFKSHDDVPHNITDINEYHVSPEADLAHHHHHPRR